MLWGTTSRVEGPQALGVQWVVVWYLQFVQQLELCGGLSLLTWSSRMPSILRPTAVSRAVAWIKGPTQPGQR
ncbi:hypothetical protein F5J12DRAFT_243171 [Pisolithus orientalis]|uniref:uncharacterized protein n=1 Tax=Pisolithus orientalis TaxID=936130 RepID=UPI002224F046|nr:uncharacterized protein F5J12DRAFT_243171 [Pisolithus orientalis]KAI6001698.1 hypothetical protein F5J12DRAFT_243171 [Pisolithus orientalis]